MDISVPGADLDETGDYSAATLGSQKPVALANRESLAPEDAGFLFDHRNRLNGRNLQGTTVERKWVAVTAYQPIDIITKHVEVPLVKTTQRIVPKIIYQDKITQVPKPFTKYIEKIVRVPEIKIVEKEVEIPQVVYKYKYVPKIILQEKVIEKPVIIEEWYDRIVEIPEVEEIFREREVEEFEEVIKYIPKREDDYFSKEDSNVAVNESLSPQPDGYQLRILPSANELIQLQAAAARPGSYYMKNELFTQEAHTRSMPVGSNESDTSDENFSNLEEKSLPVEIQSG